MTRKSRLSKLEAARPNREPVHVTITRRIVDRAQNGELYTVSTERRDLTVTTAQGPK